MADTDCDGEEAGPGLEAAWDWPPGDEAPSLLYCDLPDGSRRHYFDLESWLDDRDDHATDPTSDQDCDDAHG